ncbi:Transposase_28 domain-containing protein [Cephalotus follicularis]|uniref:Transposase_28 domain-containing protein n=1 Tax=Cephalotus follicularis TaxID=3775 RepID=A0A1Q3D0P0_CEPFO|nr:Transposase_28 domain-containing protein [Cephalotus follicularis]
MDESSPPVTETDSSEVDGFGVSTLTMDEVVELARKFNFPSGLRFSLPKDPRRVTKSKEGFFVVSVGALGHGLRIPVSTFALSILETFQIHPSLLQPQSWSFIMGFLVRCQESGVTPTMGLFKQFHVISSSPGKPGYFFKSRPGVIKILTKPTQSIKNWRKRYFLVTNLEGFTPPPSGATL